MDNQIETQTEDNAVLVVQYEQPTIGEVAKQTLIATGITLGVTALAYGAVYATAAVAGAVSNGLEKRRLRKIAKQEATEVTTDDE